MSDRTVVLLEEIERWVKIIGIQEARDVLRNALSDRGDIPEEELRIIYHLTNGENSQSDIESHVSASSSTISNKQQLWASMGLIEKDQPNSPYKHLITLEEAGIEVPSIPNLNGDNDD